MKIGLKLPLFASTELGRVFTYQELQTSRYKSKRQDLIQSG